MGNTQLKNTVTNSDAESLSEENMQFLLNNTNFNRDQLNEWFNGFKRDCPKGQMDFDLFLKFYSNFYPNGDPELFCKRIFKVFDTNNNKYIDFNELIISISVFSLGNLDQKLQLAFKIYDLGILSF
jgi:Ca2+-binding EF-hand superfamily protein